MESLNSEQQCRNEEDNIGDRKQHFHVLAVDDSHIDRKLLERLLTVSSYQVTCVESGDKALEYLGLIENIEKNECEIPTNCCTASSSKSFQQHQVSKVNLIMTDYNMPGISGYDLLKRVKDSSWKDVPVVVMSSENVQSRINMCLEGGAEEFLLKPVKMSDLRKLHSHLLQTKSNGSINVTKASLDDNDIVHQKKDDNDIEEENHEMIIRENDITNFKDEKDQTNNDIIIRNCCSNMKRKLTTSSSSSSNPDLSDRRPRVVKESIVLPAVS